MTNKWSLMIGFLLSFFLLNHVQADEAVVIEVRKKVKLHKTEKVYNDYFISGGTKMGIDKGSVISVVRRVPVHDPFQNSAIGDFRIKVADLEIIHADSDKSIGRLVAIDRRAERPMLKFDSVMIGDRLDLQTLRSKPSVQEETARLLMPGSPLSGLRMPSSVLMEKKQESPMKKQEALLTNEQP